ncbi:hypothetical protein AXF42_Ash012473 [Apostasia shenzhenica]|uniref:Uncharacterized protein n=1 Tax=Apostasia shenzhenica TaxID=1088818 RepID=A0A2I0AQW3_9ASPA|nr:hypothetical protein AXF42_Ash012473 [Apostasia shenzhenica]
MLSSWAIFLYFSFRFFYTLNSKFQSEVGKPMISPWKKQLPSNSLSDISINMIKALPPELSPTTMLTPFPGGRKHGCDLSDGRWVRDAGGGGTAYTNETCKWLPESKKCGKYGKKGGYVGWRWQPKVCELPRFVASEFFDIVKGRKLAFVGDSVARNQADSLVCLLSQMDTPKSFHKDDEDRFPVWYFESHDFTLMVFWTRFLIEGTERIINGSGSGVFDLYLDKIDKEWTKKLTFIDYAVISTGHWFFRKIYLHEGGKLIGCIYCSEKNISNIDVPFGLQKALKTALNFLNENKEYKDIFTLLRTFSPAHFENGTWHGGGYCNRTRPFDEGEVNLIGTYWEIHNLQVEEMNSIKAVGKRRNRGFELLDITKAMMMRPDAHPDTHWNNQWMRGYSDCVHWCMPGAVDMWNDILLTLLKKYRLQIDSTNADKEAVADSSIFCLFKALLDFVEKESLGCKRSSLSPVSSITRADPQQQGPLPFPPLPLTGEEDPRQGGEGSKGSRTPAGTRKVRAR